MQVVGLIAQKGGASKTTLSTNLAVAFARDGTTTLLLDLDPQASACRLLAERDDPMLIAQDCAPGVLDRALKTARDGGVDLCIIDTPPRADRAALEVARQCDLVIVPVRPTRLDLEALRETADILALVRKPALVVITQAPTAHSSKVIEQARDVVSSGFQLPLADTVMHNRLSYQHATASGQSTMEYEPKGAAAAEIAALATEVAAKLSLQHHNIATEAVTHG
jgi:chromosome partitioning protein